MIRRSCASLVGALVAVGCIPAPVTDGGGSSDDGGSSSSSDGASTSTGMPVDADSTTGVTPAPGCADYLACLEDTDSPELSDAQAMYGPDSPCWNDAASATTCATECETGLEACMVGGGEGTGEDPPPCSLPVLAPGVESPVQMGEGAGMIPTEIGVIIENFCGCHLVENNEDLVPLTPEYNGTIRFATWDEVQSQFQGQPTYREIELRSITQLNMPPVYHCDSLDFGSLTADAYAVLADWLAQGAPDGASWTPK